MSLFLTCWIESCSKVKTTVYECLYLPLTYLFGDVNHLNITQMMSHFLFNY